jgi:hypothetical protein
MPTIGILHTSLATLPIATVHHRHSGLVWGIFLIAAGTMHLVFRQWRARRWKAVHDARQDTAPTFAKSFYRRHDQNFYVTVEALFGIGCLLVGVVLLAANL